MKAIPKYFFHNENGSIEIRRFSIEIEGSLEGAARAFAEEILKNKQIYGETAPLNRWDYMSVIRVEHIDSKYTLTLLEAGQGLIDPEVWANLKKDVEKICNNLTVFL